MPMLDVTPCRDSAFHNKLVKVTTAIPGQLAFFFNGRPRTGGSHNKQPIFTTTTLYTVYSVHTSQIVSQPE